MILTFTRIELSHEPSGQPTYQKFVGGRYVGIVRTVPVGYCGHCGSRQPNGQSCLCFDNGSE